MMESKTKAFTFGVLNKSDSRETKLVFRSIVSPDLYKQDRWGFESEEENAARFDALLKIPTVAQRLAALRLPLALPKEAPEFFVGRSVHVDLEAGPNEKRDSEARRMLDNMGPVQGGAMKRSGRLKPQRVDHATCAMDVGPSELQECALNVHFHADEGYAIVVQHYTSSGEKQIGELTLVFLPDHPLNRWQKKTAH